MKLEDRILGSLAGAAIGDAMGATTEQMTIDEIISKYDGLVDRFYPPEEDRPFAAGRSAAQITDDASLMMELVKVYVEAGNRPFTPEDAATSLLRWADKPEYYPRFAGPSTMAAIDQLRAGEDPRVVGKAGTLSSERTSNGGAMKIAPAGLANPGNPEAAAKEACIVCLPSHGTQIAMSSAAAIAAGVAEACRPGADTLSVAQACMYGATEGERLGKQWGRTTPGPSIRARIMLAIHLALESRDLEDACRKIADYVGAGLGAAEAVPAAVGLFVAANGTPLKAIMGGVNVGDDTDTIACMSGALAGALHGIHSIPSDLYEQVEKANNLNLEEWANKLACVARQKQPQYKE
ncbi:MAG: ADP-ribosylglycohydrolase family protein [Firmicutes bacterium]|jgi:ADP-ribosylglycohydrolase|nr:ADP-ribosylglycohydrolase family protein [Bacillota bacterium]MDD3600078.1 ADP-ribosylglycohydrolase family protein [Bacillota bacterium]MDD4792622.1 ADP-ribosylglycohydrolase family protein [Bacillota bacterium]